MALCFICNSKLSIGCTRVCSSKTPHSNVPFSEKVAELLGDEFVVIVTPTDHICKNCTSLLTYLEKVEIDLNLARNTLKSYIQKKYRLLPSDNSVKIQEVINGNLKTEEQLEAGEKNVPSDLTTVRDNSEPTQQQQQQQQQQGSPKLNIYKCQFCSYQSRELEHVRSHMLTHLNKDGEKTSTAKTEPLTNGEKAARTVQLTQAQQKMQKQKKKKYRCSVCSSLFDCREKCVEHIQRNHAELVPTTGNMDKGAEGGTPQTTKNINNPDTKKFLINQKAKTALENDKHNGTVDTDIVLNNNVVTDKNVEGDDAEEEPAQEEDMSKQESTQQDITEKKGRKDKEVGLAVLNNVDKVVEGYNGKLRVRNRNELI